MPAIHILHRASALVIGVFIIAHMTNHIAGLSGQQQHWEVMQTFRVVYRQPLVEISILTLFLWQTVTGIALIKRIWKTKNGLVDWIRIVSGSYILLFLVNHIGAIFYARAVLNVDTEFYFAASGIHADILKLFFIPYYVLAVAALFTHIGCAFDRMLGQKSLKVRSVSLAAFSLAGAVLGIAIVMALAGMLFPVSIPQEYEAIFGGAASLHQISTDFGKLFEN